MAGKNETDLSAEIAKLIESEGFSKLNDDLKSMTLSTYNDRKEDEEKKKNGLLGDFFGSYSENIALFIAFVICLSLIIVGFIYLFISPDYKQNTNIEFWQLIIPVITAALGYIFGVGSSK